MPSGKDRIELMKTLNITVIDGSGGDNLYLGRYGIYIPYNITNFMLMDDSQLVTDVLRRFRERQMDIKPPTEAEQDECLADAWQKAKKEIELELMISQEPSDIRPPINYTPEVNPIIAKKKNIRNILIEKGLVCSVME